MSWLDQLRFRVIYKVRIVQLEKEEMWGIQLEEINGERRKEEPHDISRKQLLHLIKGEILQSTFGKKWHKKLLLE